MKKAIHVLSLVAVTILVSVYCLQSAFAEVVYDQNGFSAVTIGTVLQDDTEIFDRKPLQYNGAKAIAVKNKDDAVRIKHIDLDFYAIELPNDDIGYVEINKIGITSGNPPRLGVGLKGDVNMSIEQGDLYVEPGYYAYDQDGNDVTENVEIIGTVKTNVIGTYELYYDDDLRWAGFDETEDAVRYVTVVRKVDPNKTAALLQKSSEHEKGKWRKETYLSSDGLMSVDVWIDGITKGKATIRADYTWLGEGSSTEADFYTVLPNLQRTYSRVIKYENIGFDGTFKFVLYIDKAPQLEYSVKVDAISNLNSLSNRRVSFEELVLTRDEKDFLRNMNNQYSSIEFEELMRSCLNKIIPSLRDGKVPRLTGIMDFALSLMIHHDYDTIKELINDEIIIDQCGYSDLSYYEKYFLVNLLGSYETNLINYVSDQEQLDALVNQYLSKLP